MEKQEIIQLVCEAQSGDSAAISVLYEKYKNEVYSIAMRETKNRALSDDIVQETFVEVILKINDLKNPASFPSWLKIMAYHQCTRYYKKKETVHEITAIENDEGWSVFDAVEETNASFIPDEALDQKEFKNTILAMIDDLPDVQRSALHMFYFEELPLKVIAEVQDVSVNTANTRLNRGRKAIKNSIEQYEKKHGIRLHTIVFFPFFKWLLSGTEETMSAVSSTAVARNISSATGVEITATGAVAGTTATAATTTAATVSTGAAAGIGAKLAVVPLVVKIISGIAAVAVALGISAVIGNREESPATEPPPTDPIVENQTEMTETEPVDFDLYYEPISEQYRVAMEQNLGMDPQTGMWLDNVELGKEINCLIPMHSRSYSNYGGMDPAEFQIYYALIDLNADGVNEYFIGAGTSREDARIYDVFSLDGTSPVRVINEATLGERTIMTVYEDMGFSVSGSGGAYYHGVDFYVLEIGQTKPTLLYAYEQDGETTFYYIDDSENRSQISEEKYIDGTKSADRTEFQLPWVQISSSAEGEQDTVMETPTEPVTPELPMEPRVNLVDTFTPERQRAVNIFLSNFVEQAFGGYPDEDAELLNFAYMYCKLNKSGYIEDVDTYQTRISDDYVDIILQRFFGHSISHRSMQTRYGTSYEYRDGYYYIPAAEGEFHGYFAVVHEMYQNEDGTYDVSFTTYYGEIEYAPGVVGLVDNPREYYGLSPEDIQDHPELVATRTRKAVLRNDRKSDGSDSYQLVSLE